MSLPAKVISQGSFVQPSLSSYDLPDIKSIIESLLSLPALHHGEAYGAEAGEWYRVNYGTPILDGTPIAVARVRPSVILDRVIPEVPDILFQTIPKIEDVLRISDITRITRHDFNSDHYCDIVGAGARDRAKNLPVIPILLGPVWGWMCDVFVYNIFYYGWRMQGWILNVLWDTFVQPQVDNTFDALMAQTDEVRNAILTQTDKVTEAVNVVIGDVNEKVAGQLQKIQDALNLRLEDLYATWGLPKDVAVTSVHLRNVDDYGFEFQSYGDMTVYWICLGKPGKYIVPQ